MAAVTTPSLRPFPAEAAGYGFDAAYRQLKVAEDVKNSIPCTNCQTLTMATLFSGNERSDV